MLYKILITLLLIATSNAQNFKNQLSGGYSGRGGNTEYWYYNLNYALTEMRAYREFKKNNIL